MTEILNIAASGKDAVIGFGNDMDVLAEIREAVLRGDSTHAFPPGDLQFQVRNRSRRLPDCLPIVGLLSAICCNAHGVEYFGSIDSQAKFIRLAVAPDHQYSIYVPSLILNPFESEEGIETLLDGRKRLRTPRFSKLPENQMIFRLDETFENPISCYCVKNAMTRAQKNRVTGLAFWDYTKRIELLT